MASFTTLTSTVAPVPMSDIDTDQIIPARYLKVTDRSGMGEGLFSNWRDSAEFFMNKEEYDGAQILLAGDNFGCGSSREHAPWALLDYGFRAVISTRFADIFTNNSLKNGLLIVAVEEAVWHKALALVTDDPRGEFKIDLESLILTLPTGDEIPFEVDAFARRCLLDGVDQFGYLVGQIPEVEAWESQRTPRVNTKST